MRTVRNLAVVMLTTLSGSLAAQQPPAQQAANANNRWAEPKCDVKPNNVQVNQGMMSLKSSTTSKDPDQKKKDLDDAGRYLNQALTQGGQDKNPAAWYYLGRYYIMTNNAEGTDSAFTKAQALKPECKDDIGIWRRYVWVPTFNAGIAAWQANNIDSAIASFRRANFLLPSEPTGFKYVATLFYNTKPSIPPTMSSTASTAPTSCRCTFSAATPCTRPSASPINRKARTARSLTQSETGARSTSLTSSPT